MIARIWHGVTTVENSEAYTEYLQKTGIPDYKATPGNKGVFLMRRMEDDGAHFLILTLWDSREEIRSFAGDNIDKARYYPEDEQFLLELEPFVKHYELIGD